MKLKNRLPLKIRQTVSAIYDDMDYFEYMEGSEASPSSLWTTREEHELCIQTLKQIVHKQNILINHLLQQTVISEEVPSHPAGVYADKISFQGWFSSAGEILEDMKQGEIVIVYNKEKDASQAQCNRFFVPKHYEKDIYVCMQDSPTSERDFSKLKTTIGKHSQIINNFINRKEGKKDDKSRV